MGGLASLYFAKAHGDVIGSVRGLLTLPAGAGWPAKLMPDFASNSQWLKSTRFYIDMGTKGGGAGYPPHTDPKSANDPAAAQDAINDARQLVAAFDSAGMTRGKDYVYEEVPGGEFNESAWQTRVEPMLKSIFPPAPATQPTAGGGN
jgi:hypothetical protein